MYKRKKNRKTPPPQKQIKKKKNTVSDSIFAKCVRDEVCVCGGGCWGRCVGWGVWGGVGWGGCVWDGCVCVCVWYVGCIHHVGFNEKNMNRAWRPIH